MIPTTSTSSTNIWEKVAQELQENGGVASLPLADLNLFAGKSQIQTHDWEEFFQVARNGMDHCKQLSSSSSFFITPDQDSAHVTGWHSAGCESDAAGSSLSRYNEYREGFIFSDGELFDMDTPEDNTNFRTAMENAFHYLHDGIAQNVLSGIAKCMNIEQDWFQANLGPINNASQWHVKRYVTTSPSLEYNVDDLILGDQHHQKGEKDQQEQEILPMHTDPSLISIVIHDRPGIHSGGLGLQYLSPSTADATVSQTTMSSNKNNKKTQKIWKDINAHGHGVATIFTGSVLSLLTGGAFPAACHRVIFSDHKERMAITLFVRPNGKAMLQVPPSPLFLDKVKVKQMTFDAWNAKVSRNYMKQKSKKTKDKNNNNTDEPSKLNSKVNVEYYCDEYTELSILTANPGLTGREKYLGGEVGNNNIIYTIPGHAKRVLAIDPAASTVIPIGPEYEGEYKWLRAVKIPTTGVIYGIPCHANCILKIVPETNEITTFGHEVINNEPNQDWKWHGGVYSAHDGCVYCIPQFAEQVLKIDPNNNDSLSLIGPRLLGRNKWYGGLLGRSDGAIYGIPQNANGILRIDPKTQEITVHGDYGLGGYKWHGGVVEKRNGIIYGIPAHADRVLKITPGLEPKLELIGDTLRTGSHRSDGKYKFLGGVCGHDGHVYFFPSDTDYVVQINTLTDEVKEVGPNLTTCERIRQNKWQNGFIAPDGSIYGIPLKSESILRIRPGENGENPEVTTIGGPYKGLNKWEGGVMAMDGSMYCMPLNHRGVLRMRPLGSMKK